MLQIQGASGSFSFTSSRNLRRTSGPQTASKTRKHQNDFRNFCGLHSQNRKTKYSVSCRDGRFSSSNSYFCAAMEALHNLHSGFADVLSCTTGLVVTLTYSPTIHGYRPFSREILSKFITKYLLDTKVTPAKDGKLFQPHAAFQD